MQLTTTFRGLSESESAQAARTLERNAGRIERLLDKPVPLKAVVEGGAGGHRVVLTMAVDGEDLVAQSNGHDLATAITNASERIRSQLVKNRRRRETNRQRGSGEIVEPPREKTPEE
jgi:ribosome-associated translation inhibitor RaiA